MLAGSIARPVSRRLALSITLALAFPARAVSADPTLGFLEDWPGTSLQGWGGGATNSNPGRGGVGGSGDGFLMVATPSLGRLAVVGTGAPYTGNWQAAGITRIDLWLDDVGNDDSLEIHVAIGNGANFWIYNQGFRPPEHAWAEFSVDLTSSSGFTRIIGTGSFDQALQSADRIQIRHDLPPFGQSPDPIQADVGIDHLLLGGESSPVEPVTWGRIKALYR